MAKRTKRANPGIAVDDPKAALVAAEKLIERAGLSNDTALGLGGLGLTELPASLAQLTQLERLNLDRNQLTDLPATLGNLNKLKHLNIGENQLTVLPNVICHLTALEDLEFYQNPLKTLPDGIGQLTNLRSLNAWSNQLTIFPKSLCDLRDLTWLNIHTQRFEWLPEEIGQLSLLKSFRISHNHLTALPESIGELIELEELYLSDNRLTALPEGLRQLTKLKLLFLQNNPALGLPPEVLGPGWEDTINRMKETAAKPANLLDYYFRTRGGRQPLNEAKLILLGRGEVGKTALVNRLVHDKFAPTSLTRGIAITQWSVALGKDTVRLHVWDFGGQEIQHATHQFFLTERSLYLVVLNGRAGAEDEDAEYWLKFVKTFGGSSPTIVVLNKFKMQRFELNRRALQEKYAFIRGFIETDCRPKTNNGILSLTREIKFALAAMEHVRAAFPVGWFQIKDHLGAMKEPFISFDEYRKICAELGESDVQAQEQLAGFLDDLGIALNFREDHQLREETVLNPHWITQGVYQIITSKEIAEKQGVLRLSDLKSIFHGKKLYPPRMHGFLIELMRKFELCFQYQEDPEEHRYLVPELLGKEKPELKEPFPPEQCLNFRFDYRLMPEGLLPRLITRTHTLSQPGERWRTGVVLRWEGARALVEADKQERQVIVRVLGEWDKRRRLLAVIRENFDQIHAEMNEFKPTEWIALEGHPEGWTSIRELEVFEQKNVLTMSKTVGDDIVPVDVKKALDNADVPGVRDRGVASLEEKRPLKLFISYAHEDEKWRSKLAPNLDLLQREGLVELWCDLQIKPGDKWDDEIKQKLNEADLYVFLMSTDLLNSDYVRKTELPIAKQRHEEKKARLVPVVLRRCSWDKEEYLKAFQGLPKGARPVKEWPDKDQAFHSVEEGLREAIAELRKMLRRR